MIEDAPPRESSFGSNPLAEVKPRPEPTERIDPLALRAWRVSGALTTAAVLLLAIAMFVIFRWAHLPWYAQALPLVAVVVTAALEIWLIPEVRWRRWRYAVTDRELDLMHGVVIVTRTVIPMVRVQHVDTKQGPVLRHYGLATVEVATAAGTQEIPALAIETADRLRHRIAALAGVAEDV